MEDNRSESTDSESCDTPDLQSVCPNSLEQATTYFFKVLIGREIIGKLLGHNGVNITKLAVESGAKLKFSQSNELFPGTGCRILNMYGKQSSILRAIDMIVKTLFEEQQIPNVFVEGAGETPALLGPVLCLVPLGLAGSVIGKGGSTIKGFADRSGCKLQFSGSFDPYNTYERIISFAAPTAEAIVFGIRLVFECLVSHPVGISIKNRITVELSSRTRSFAATKPLLDCYFDASRHDMNTMHGMMITPPHSGHASPLSSPRAWSDEKCPAHGIRPPSPSMAFPPLAPEHFDYQPYMVFPPGSNFVHDSIPSSCPVHVSPPNSPTLLPVGGNSLDYISKYMTVPVVENSSAKDGMKLQMTLGMDERVIGCIIGKHGLVIQDLMNFTKTSITVSKRGQYQPNSSFRIVTAHGYLDQLQFLNSLILNRLIETNCLRNPNAQQQVLLAQARAELAQHMHQQFCCYQQRQQEMHQHFALEQHSA